MKFRMAVAQTLILLSAFLYMYSFARKNTILTAEPWVDTERNVILISFDGEVHEYEYYEE